MVSENFKYIKDLKILLDSNNSHLTKESADSLPMTDTFYLDNRTFPKKYGMIIILI
jgi:hypothetical protein